MRKINQLSMDLLGFMQKCTTITEPELTPSESAHIHEHNSNNKKASHKFKNKLAK